MTEKKKALLCAVNSKYVHTNLALRYIKAYSDKHSENVKTEIFETTINENNDTVKDVILSKNADIIAFSCYIWNIEYIKSLIRKIKNENPSVIIALGGPEVSFNAKFYLENDFCDYVQCGDGEKAMAELFESICTNAPVPENFGICYKSENKIVISPYYTEKDLDSIESPYTEEYLNAVNGKIAYIETSRGCPFSCKFCLSGETSGVRYFSEDYVKNAISLLFKSGAATVKFVDRTFNANEKHANMIISYILENYGKCPSKVCFHFEIEADILKESTLALLSKASPGLFQIEAGLQSFNPCTLKSVSRKPDTDKICENVKKIISFGNIHTHIDLIAGLPFENLDSFKRSFDKAYGIGAQMLQLGFLKLIHGSALKEESDIFGFAYSDTAPYEIESTSWLSEKDIETLKEVEDANEKIANSGRFKNTLEYVLSVCKMSPFDLFLGFGKRKPMPLDEYTSLVFEYFSLLPFTDKKIIRDKMCIDRLLSNTSAKLPECLKVKDPRLAKITHILNTQSDSAPKKNTKRCVCILYSENKVIYADYPDKKSNYSAPEIKYLDLAEFDME